MNVLSAALTGPSRLVGVAWSLPGRMLDVIDRDRVAGRRASLRNNRAMIEVRGVQRPDGAQLREALVAALEQLPGVAWAGVNAPLARLIVALNPTHSLALPTLIAVVERVEHDHTTRTQQAERDYSGADNPAQPTDCEGGDVTRAWWGLAVNVAGLVGAVAGATVGFTPVPTELAALVTAVDAQPRLRGWLEVVLGRSATDLGLAVLAAAGQGLAGGWAGLAVDAASRISALGEVRAAQDAWQAAEGTLLADQQRASAAPVVVERPRPLPPGPVETYAERVGLLGLGAAGVMLPITGSPRRAAAMALAAVPKAGRVGREAFASGLGRCVARRGAVVIDPVALRRLDRVDTVVLDTAVLGNAALDTAVASASVEMLAGAARRGGVRVIVADNAVLGRVRSLQSSGAVVLLVSGHHGALGQADVGIGITDADGHPPWGAHVLVGDDLELAALLIEACGTARQVSRRAVILSQAGSVVGGISALSAPGWASGPARAAMLGVNGAAAASFGQGCWSAQQLASQPPPILPTVGVPWHAMTVDAVLEQVDTTAAGLTEGEAARRLSQARRQHPELVQPSLARAVLAELDNPLTPILAGGAMLSASLGSVVDAGLVAGVGALSALIGGAQRLHTDRAVAALLARSAVTARVLRDGTLVSRPADQLVSGDVVELVSGDVVPADCRVLAAAGLQVDESALTGEPFPVTKAPDAVGAATPAERSSMLYEGTTVAAGRGSAVVVATGAATEVGRSMAATRGAAPPTGVETRLAAITDTTLPIALGSAGAIVAAGLLRRRPLRESLGAGVSLAVASVPEGLPFLVSAAQLASARRLSERGALVRNPRTIEALGRVDTLCFDKTGTLTQGRISLAAVADPIGEPIPVEQLTGSQRHILCAALRATPRPRRGQPLAHLTDRAIAEGAQAAGIDCEDDLPGWQRLSALPFEPSRGYHATLGVADVGSSSRATNPLGGTPLTAANPPSAGIAVLSVKGAPETVLPRCTQLRDNSRVRPLDEGQQARVNRRIAELAGQGYRVLAVAERPVWHRHHLEDEDVSELTLLGFVALADPVRPTAAASIAELQKAGVHIVMITGDHPATAKAIASQLGVRRRGRVITGPELDDLADATLDRLLPEVTVVARGTPGHKLRVVQAFQRLRRTVAMTGDGANDAPAIRLAEVGIALGHRATPAARTAADLVVSDDRLETIIAAFIEGRAMWGSVRQALGILVGGNLGEIAFTVLGAALTGRSPLSARQLLLVNLLTDLAPAMAITLRAPRPEATATLLAEGPEASLGAALTRDITTRAITTAIVTSAAWLTARLTGRATRARTVALAALVGAQLGQTVAIGGPNPPVLASSVGSAAVLIGTVQTPGVSHLFGCTPLGPVGWTIAGAATTAATAVTVLLPPLLSWLRPTRDDQAPTPPTAVHADVAEPSTQSLLVVTAGS
jgi:magnesium-transporting ATPase (P-type)